MTPIQIYLTLRDGQNAIEWYVKNWKAEERAKQMADDNKRVLHATLGVFGGEIMLSDEFPEHDDYVASPASKGGTTVTVHINMPDRAALDQAISSAADGGAKITMPAAEMFWGAYYGRLVDPFGHSWSFAAE